NLVFENKVVRYFLTAAPSLAEIVMLGKVWWHAARETERGRPRWDLVVLDAPATGHGLTLLTVPDVFLTIVSEGPLARDMRDMQALLKDSSRCRFCRCRSCSIVPSERNRSRKWRARSRAPCETPRRSTVAKTPGARRGSRAPARLVLRRIGRRREDDHRRGARAPRGHGRAA